MIHAAFRNGEYHLSSKQVGRLIAAANPGRDTAIVRLLAETGLRRAELAALDDSDLDHERSLLTVRNGKGGKLRFLPITSVLKAELVRLRSANGNSALFRSSRGARLSVRQINRIVAAAGRRAAVTNPNPRHDQITCHLLRHTFSRLWKAHGGSIETLSRILGHASVKTTLDVYGLESLIDVQRNYEHTIARITRGMKQQFNQWR